MADAQTNIKKFQEIANRGLQDQLDPQTRQRFDEAVSRGLVTQTQAPTSAPTITSTPDVGLTPKSLQGQDPAPEFTAGEEAIGALETGAALVSGSLTVPAAGIAGLARAGVATLRGEEDPLKIGAELSEKIAGSGFQPRTEAGKATLENVSKPFQALSEITTGAGNVVLEATGSPALATATKTALEAAPMALGIRRPGRTVSDRNVDVRGVVEELGELGLKTDAPIVTQRGQLVESAKDRAGGQVQKAEGIGDVQASIQGSRLVEEGLVNKVYADARSLNAEISSSQVRDLQTAVTDSLRERVISKETTPATTRILTMLDDIVSPGEPVSVRRLEEFRIQNNAVRGSKRADNEAISEINSQVSSYLRAQASKDLVSGDVAAVAKWEEAFKATKDFKEVFDTDKVIQDLSTRINATPEQAKNWIFGANAVNAKRQAGAVVKQIGEILGKDSPEYGMLRQEVLFDIVEPLLKAEPNLKTFANNYDKFVRNNMTLGRELFPDSMGEMLTLRRFAASLERGTARGLDLNLNQTLARILFGHEIAKGAVRVNLGTNLMNIIRGTAGSSPKQLLISDFTGYDITKPLLPKTPIVIGGAQQTAEQGN